MRQAVISLASKKYLSRTLLALESFTKHNPGWDSWLLLADEPQGYFRPEDLPVSMLSLDELQLPEALKYKFRYTETDFAISLKPAGILHLLEKKGYDRVLYLDGDTYTYSRFEAMEQALHTGVQLLLTPHIIKAVSVAPYGQEKALLRGGVFNLGFLAVNKGPQSLELLHWWAQILETESVVETWSLTRDQKWLSLIPGFFDSYAVLRHPGYNVAPWNLRERGLKWAQGAYRCLGEPLAFFHFGIFDAENPVDLKSHQAALSFEDPQEIGRIMHEYAGRVKAHPLFACMKWPYAYSRFKDGKLVFEGQRRRYRQDPELQRLCGDDPFSKSSLFWASGALRSSGLAVGLWLSKSPFFPILPSWLRGRIQRILRKVGL